MSSVDMPPSRRPDRTPDVSIVIPNWNGGEVLTRCVDSILEHTTGIDYELILIDNGSTDGSRDTVTKYAARDERISAIFNDENLMFARACNQGWEASRGRFLLVANNDIVLTDDAVSRLVEYAEGHPEIGSVTPLFVSPDGSPQELFRRLPNALFILAHYHRLGRAVDRFLFGRHFQRRYLYRDLSFDTVETVEQPGASFTLLPRTSIERLSLLFDERYALLFNDVDLAYRLRTEGLASVVVPDVRVIHLGGVSSDKLEPKLYQDFQFKAMFTYFRIHHPLQWALLACAWPQRAVAASRQLPSD